MSFSPLYIMISQATFMYRYICVSVNRYIHQTRHRTPVITHTEKLHNTRQASQDTEKLHTAA